MSAAADTTLRHTALHQLHVELGARMVAFAGYAMPLQYSSGILKEHLHTRAAAGLFDVSHMGQITLRPRSGGVEEAARALESLVCADICGLGAGRQRYALLTDPVGGILDDLMVANLGDRLALIVNASRKHADEAHLRAQISRACAIELRERRALIALQGPAAEAVLARLAPVVATMKFMDATVVSLLGIACEISRSGYTGEDGFEISVADTDAERLARVLLGDALVAPAGLGARDSLRLEAGLCLYGADLDARTSPVEAALEWSIGKSRRSGGARPGGFPGAATILDQLARGAPRRRVGVRPAGRMPVRAGAALFADRDAQAAIGAVTSGSFGPSVDAPVAMGYVPAAFAAPGTPLLAEVRGSRVAVTVCDLPFVDTHYRRNRAAPGEANAQVHQGS